MEPARAGEADVVSGVKHARRIAQKLARPLDGDRLEERLRRQPGPALEHVLEMGGREADMAGDRLDRRLVAIAFGDELDRALDGGVIRAGGRGVWHIEHGPWSEYRCAAGGAARVAGVQPLTRADDRRPPENDGRRRGSSDFVEEPRRQAVDADEVLLSPVGLETVFA